MIRSPSQCPGTARSSASAGRSADQHLVGDERLALVPRVRARGTRSARPVRRHAASSRRSAPRPWTIQRLVDRLVADPHGLIVGEVELQPVAICSGLQAVPHRRSCAAPVAATLPRHVRPGDRPSRRRRRPPRPDVLHVLAQPRRWPPAWPASGAARPARPSTARPRPGRPAPRHGSRRCGAARARSSTGRGPAPRAISRTPQPGPFKHRDLLTLGERQVPARRLGQADRWHAATVAEPPRTHRPRHAHRDPGVLTGDAPGDQPPERPLHTPRRRRPARGPQPGPNRPVRSPLPTTTRGHLPR